MKKISEMKKHFQALVNGGAVYVWGANCENITEESINAIYNRAHSAKYNRAYYDSKLKEGKGRVGADCSGAFYPMSGYDTTANGYYNKCVSKGTIGSLPKSTPCMVFIKQGGKMVHIGWYDGAGKVYEMRSSKMNVRYDALSDRWTHWGKPEFVDYTAEDQKGEKIMIELDELGKGARGEQVKTVQRLLNSMGYVSGTVDGIFGAKTVKAVKSFQKKEGLSQDGIVGRKSWNALLK